MSCRASRDEHGTTYHIGAVKTSKTPGGQVLSGSASVDVWWGRMFKAHKNDEMLMIRQEQPGTDKADVVTITLGQVYDLIHALGWAVERQ